MAEVRIGGLGPFKAKVFIHIEVWGGELPAEIDTPCDVEVIDGRERYWVRVDNFHCTRDTLTKKIDYAIIHGERL